MSRRGVEKGVPRDPSAPECHNHSILEALLLPPRGSYGTVCGVVGWAQAQLPHFGRVSFEQTVPGLLRRFVVKTVFPWVASRANMLY